MLCIVRSHVGVCLPVRSSQASRATPRATLSLRFACGGAGLNERSNQSMKPTAPLLFVLLRIRPEHACTMKRAPIAKPLHDALAIRFSDGRQLAMRGFRIHERGRLLRRDLTIIRRQFAIYSCRIEAVCVKTLQDGKSSFGPNPPKPQAPWRNSRLSEIARVLVRLNHVTRSIVNANHGIMRAAAMLGKADCVANCVWPGIPQRTETQSVGD
jgi:hypothetical protein